MEVVENNLKDLRSFANLMLRKMADMGQLAGGTHSPTIESQKQCNRDRSNIYSQDSDLNEYC